MVAKSTKEIVVQVRVVSQGQEIPHFSEYRIPFGKEFTIGRDHKNTVAPSFSFVSANHGKITSSTAFLGLKTKVSYEDTSSKGTWYLPPGQKDISRAVPVHNEKIDIPSNCRLLILNSKKQYGVSLQVIF